jgi:hypothetical protein
MSCEQHETHSHKHGNECGHRTIAHEGHTDYLQGGRYYVGSFMLSAALRAAEKVIGGRHEFVTGKRST